MNVKAKMTCTSKVEKSKGEWAIDLSPVTSGSAENDSFYKYTPGGQCRLETINESAANAFEVNKSYYVTFEEAPE